MQFDLTRVYGSGGQVWLDIKVRLSQAIPPFGMFGVALDSIVGLAIEQLE